MMTMRNQQRRRHLINEINVVPYIDVMLVLLVIFMITAPLLSQGVKVNLPQAKAKALSVKQNGPIIVSIDKHGHYYLNVSQSPSVPMLASKLVVRVAAELAVSRQKHQDRSVVVKGDRDVNYGKVVRLMVLLQNAGVEKVGLMTENPGDKST